MIEKILVPLDGSKLAEAVLPSAGELASRLNATVVLLQVLERGYHNISAKGYHYIVYPEQQMESDRSNAGDYLKNVASLLENKGVSTQLEVRYGVPADVIIKAADELNIDLIAMSTHGRSGISRWAYGSVADKVLHGGTTQILLTRALTKPNE